MHTYADTFNGGICKKVPLAHDQEHPIESQASRVDTADIWLQAAAAAHDDISQAAMAGHVAVDLARQTGIVLPLAVLAHLMTNSSTASVDHMNRQSWSTFKNSSLAYVLTWHIPHVHVCCLRHFANAHGSGWLQYRTFPGDDEAAVGEAELPAHHVGHEAVLRWVGAAAERLQADRPPLPVVKDLRKATVQGIA